MQDKVFVKTNRNVESGFNFGIEGREGLDGRVLTIQWFQSESECNDKLLELKGEWIPLAMSIGVQ